MTRVFQYCRVSTEEQTTENQILQAKQAGYEVQPHRVLTETISGTVLAMNRPVFAKLIERLEEGDTLIVTKLDRLGRNASDIDRTVEHLRKAGIRLIVLDLPVAEVTSAAGDLVRRMFAAFAQFERDQLVERTQAGLARAKAQGKRLGRRPSLSEAQRAEARGLLAQGKGVREVARMFGVSHPTIMRIG
jgi:putative DNA-invertase from lambdoid prophage Rac